MNQILLVADESVDFNIIETLRNNGFIVHSILEENQSASDEMVLSVAVKLNALLLTEDKDFGELTFRLGGQTKESF